MLARSSAVDCSSVAKRSRPERAAWLLRAFLSRLLFRQSQLGGGMAACRSSLLVNRSQADRGMPANVFIITLLTCSLVRKSQLESPWLQESKAESSAQKRLRERLEQASEKEAARDTAQKVKIADL